MWLIQVEGWGCGCCCSFPKQNNFFLIHSWFFFHSCSSIFHHPSSSIFQYHDLSSFPRPDAFKPATVVSAIAAAAASEKAKKTDERLADANEGGEVGKSSIRSILYSLIHVPMVMVYRVEKKKNPIATFLTSLFVCVSFARCGLFVGTLAPCGVEGRHATSSGEPKETKSKICIGTGQSKR